MLYELHPLFYSSYCPLCKVWLQAGFFLTFLFSLSQCPFNVKKNKVLKGLQMLMIVNFSQLITYHERRVKPRCIQIQLDWTIFYDTNDILSSVVEYNIEKKIKTDMTPISSSKVTDTRLAICFTTFTFDSFSFYSW